MSESNINEIEKISNIRQEISKISSCSGVYKIFIDKDGLEFLDDVNPTQTEIAKDGTKVYLLYLGSSKNVQSRFEWHLGMTNVAHSNILDGTLSTFRFSLIANHKTINDLAQQNELSSFMDTYLYMKYMCASNYHEVEDKLILRDDLPLNIKDNNHKFIKTNRARRAKIKQEYVKKYNNASEVNNNLKFVSIDYAITNVKLLPIIEDELIKNKIALLDGEQVVISLEQKSGIIADNILIEVLAPNKESFLTDANVNRQIQFSSIINNLAGVLRDLELFSKYKVSYRDGVITVQKIDNLHMKNLKIQKKYTNKNVNVDNDKVNKKKHTEKTINLSNDKINKKKKKMNYSHYKLWQESTNNPDPDDSNNCSGWCIFGMILIAPFIIGFIRYIFDLF